MSARTKFELLRWVYHIFLFSIGIGAIVLLSEFLIGPVYGWWIYDHLYQFPTSQRLLRLAMTTVELSVFVGTGSWYYEKRKSGR
jgi:hypothetical protein